MYFTNKVLWITGASSGIGKALAIEFSRQNCKLILSSRNKEALECVKIECENPKNIIVIPLDLENYTSLKQKTAEKIENIKSYDNSITEKYEIFKEELTQKYKNDLEKSHEKLRKKIEH